MDITPQDNTTQPISDDQELAKALAGVLPEEPAPEAPTANDMAFETIPVPTPVTPPVPDPVASIPPAPVVPEEQAAPAMTFPEPSAAPGLEGIKSQALSELRPLIDQVDLPADERFDAYLMLLRSTDDTSLVAPAHAAAQAIGDEKRKAEALLEIIKEIDYLSRKDA